MDWTADPIKTSHLSNPFNKYSFLETLDLPVIAELNMMGQGTPRRIKISIPTQTIVNRTYPIVQVADDISHDVALNYWVRPVNNGLGRNATFDAPRSSLRAFLGK